MVPGLIWEASPFASIYSLKDKSHDLKNLLFKGSAHLHAVIFLMKNGVF